MDPTDRENIYPITSQHVTVHKDTTNLGQQLDHMD